MMLPGTGRKGVLSHGWAQRGDLEIVSRADTGNGFSTVLGEGERDPGPGPCRPETVKSRGQVIKAVGHSGEASGRRGCRMVEVWPVEKKEPFQPAGLARRHTGEGLEQ